MTDLLHRNKFVTVRNKRSNVPPSHLQLVCEDRVLFARVDLHVSVCRQEHPECERAIRLVHLPFFCTLHFFIQAHKQKSNGVRSGDL
jgi:hypothetical protein